MGELTDTLDAAGNRIAGNIEQAIASDAGRVVDVTFPVPRGRVALEVL